jgi:hypothetical protein
MMFTPPTSGDGKDWVLVIDDGAAKFGTPGKEVIAKQCDSTFWTVH